MTAECPETPLHRSDFASLFEIAMTLTELGFKKYEMVSAITINLQQQFKSLLNVFYYFLRYWKKFLDI